MRQSVSKGQEEGGFARREGLVISKAERSVKRTKVRALGVRRVGRMVTEHMYT